MTPIPCGHCGMNFMRQTPDPEIAKLCHNCILREEKRNPKNKEVMEKSIDILIRCPVDLHNQIEEFCLNEGTNFVQYFLRLHHMNMLNRNLSVPATDILPVEIKASPVSKDYFEDEVRDKKKELNLKLKKNK